MLNESFGTPNDIEKDKTNCAIFNARMRKGAPITDHVIYMIEMIECLSKLNFPLHEQLGKDAILNSLPKYYLSFLTHFRMTKPVVNYHSLLGLLQNFEKDHRLHKESENIVGGSSSGCRSFKKGKKNKKRVQSVGASKPCQTKKFKSDQSQAECFYCKKQRHWKRNCPQYINPLDPNKSRKKQIVAGQSNYMITLCNFSICDSIT